MTAVQMHPADLDATARALALAFQDDPLQSYILPDPQERAARSPGHFATLLRYGLLFGEVFTLPEAGSGATVVLAPHQWHITPERASAAGFDQWPAIIGEVAAGRFASTLSVVEPFHHQDVSPDHWYVLVVGVPPAAQGSGRGRALLQPVLDRAAAAGQPCYLETAQPRNVGFYEHLGFKTLRNVVDPASGLPLWTFRRG